MARDRRRKVRRSPRQIAAAKRNLVKARLALKYKRYRMITRWIDAESGSSFERVHYRRALNRHHAVELERAHNRKRLDQGMKAEGFRFRILPR